MIHNRYFLLNIIMSQSKYKDIKRMFETQSIDQPFDFNVIIEEEGHLDFASDAEDEFPQDILVTEQKIICYSSRGSHKQNEDQV